MKILLAEDDLVLSKQICSALQEAGYVVDLVYDGEEAGFLGETERYDAVILDLGLPKRDGIAVLRDWRAKSLDMPVLILTARDSWREKVDGLDYGADDYLTKPFNMVELIARLRALIRRSAGQADPILRTGDIEFDTRTRTTTVSGTPVKLTAQEDRVLEVLMLHAGELMSRTALSEHVYGFYDDRDSNTIEVFIRRLRGKLGADFIHTVRGKGYRIGQAE